MSDDSSVDIKIVNGTLIEVIREIVDKYELVREYRKSSPIYVGESPYRGSNHWNIYGDAKHCDIVVDVGCWCSHDCCGHLCGLYFTIVKRDEYSWYVETHKGFNY